MIQILKKTDLILSILDNNKVLQTPKQKFL
jgi:hypothetical protein